MRVAIVAESFLPNVNGVTNSVLRVLEHARRRGDEAIVIAPGARDEQEEIATYEGFPIVRVPTVKVPLITSLPIGVPTSTMTETLRAYRPDVVHLASPFVLGGMGAIAARALRIPTVALYQTDVAGFATKYHLGPLATAAWDWTRTIHNLAHITLAPSSVTIKDLHSHGIHNVEHWGRGVDTTRFHPAKRSEKLRASWDPTGMKRIVGFVGRLAPEKGVARLISLSGRDDIQLVIVGDGPSRPDLEKLMPDAVFTGALGGEDLAHAYASLDLFVHAGEFETFCQAVQEAQASGVPTIGPRAGGPIDLIEDYQTGFLLDVDTFCEELPAAAEWILSPAHHGTMCANARDAVEGKTWPDLCEQLFGYYQIAMTRAHSTPRGIFGRRTA